MGELGAAVDARGLERLTLDRDGMMPLAVGDHDDVRKVIFVRRVGVANLSEPAEQVTGPDRHHAAVAQLDRALGLVGVLKLDHLRDVVTLAQDDAAVSFAVFGRAGEDHNTRLVFSPQPLQHPLQRALGDERGVTIEDQHRPIEARKRLLGHLDRVCRALLFGLECGGDSMPFERRLKLLAALADHDHAPVCAHRLDRGEQMKKHRLSRDGMKDLVRVGTHSRALPRGENDDREFRLVHGARHDTPLPAFP